MARTLIQRFLRFSSNTNSVAFQLDPLFLQTYICKWFFFFLFCTLFVSRPPPFFISLYFSIVRFSCFFLFRLLFFFIIFAVLHPAKDHSFHFRRRIMPVVTLLDEDLQQKKKKKHEKTKHYDFIYLFACPFVCLRFISMIYLNRLCVLSVVCAIHQISQIMA